MSNVPEIREYVERGEARIVSIRESPLVFHVAAPEWVRKAFKEDRLVIRATATTGNKETMVDVEDVIRWASHNQPSVVKKALEDAFGL